MEQQRFFVHGVAPINAQRIGKPATNKDSAFAANIRSAVQRGVEMAKAESEAEPITANSGQDVTAAFILPGAARPQGNSLQRTSANKVLNVADAFKLPRADDAEDGAESAPSKSNVANGFRLPAGDAA